MSWDNRVLWSEGLFLQPHHFQQHDRWIEGRGQALAGVGTPYPWGLRRLTIDQDLLRLGKLAITDCAGILPDSTPFDAPARDPLPAPLELGDDDAGQRLFLALPLGRPGATESGGADSRETMLRYRAAELTVRDNTQGAGTETLMEVGRLDLRLLRERDARDGFACLGLLRILEYRADRQAVLDPDYIPACVDYRAATRLGAFTDELQGLLHRQGEARAGRVRGVGRGGVSDWADFLLLQLINRAEPLAIHLGRIQGLHPEALYRHLLVLAGELATFASDAKRPPELSPYRHDDLETSFTPLIERLREYLSREVVERAIPIPIQERKFGFRVALVSDPSLLASARFVLAGQAQVDSQTLRNRFPTQIKIGPLEKIQELVKLALPGIALRPMPTAPLEIPYHAGFDYFELDRGSDFWRQLAGGGGFGLHIGGEFPGLQLELWAIRE
jgi:type VI secretion system protein ImpJ